MNSASKSAFLPIGVFDSGIGGLTVTSALRALLPNESICYLGDTARVPYGGRSRETIERYSIEIARYLISKQAKMIVVACNTASALAIPLLRKSVSVPVIGVIEPGARAALSASRSGRIGVIGTRATVASGAYEKAIHAFDPGAVVISRPCPMLVPLIEEGWLDDPLTDQVIQRYLAEFLDRKIDTLVLGCTHYPLLKQAIESFIGPDIHLVDSALNCAESVRDCLAESGLSSPGQTQGSLEVIFTDQTSGFLEVAKQALNLDIGEIKISSLGSS